MSINAKTPCILCASRYSRVLYYRRLTLTAYIRRRRCLVCGAEYETEERTARLVKKPVQTP